MKQNQPFSNKKYTTIYKGGRYETSHNCSYNVNNHLHIIDADKLQCFECKYTIRVNREGKILEVINNGEK